jgi:predicted esterase
MLDSVDYIYGLINAEVEQGVPLNRIVVGGFSQGAVISFLQGLGSRYTGRLAGIVGLSGSMPPGDLIEKAQELAKTSGGIEEDTMRIYIAHRTRDQVIPIKAFITSVGSIENPSWGTSGGKERLEPHIYEGLGCESSGRELMDIYKF